MVSASRISPDRWDKLYESSSSVDATSGHEHRRTSWTAEELPVVDSIGLITQYDAESVSGEF